MNQFVIQQIKNFGYDYKMWASEPFKGFLCNNHQSQDEFYLIFLPSLDLIEKGITYIESFRQSLSKYVVFIVEVDQHFKETIDILAKEEEKPHISYLIFDPEEDFEFFIKDLWNVLVLVNEQARSTRSKKV